MKALIAILIGALILAALAYSIGRLITPLESRWPPLARLWGRRAALVLFLLIALSLSVITDLNRAQLGRARESQGPMLMLLESLKSQPPQVFEKFDASTVPSIPQ